MRCRFVKKSWHKTHRFGWWLKWMLMTCWWSYVTHLRNCSPSQTIFDNLVLCTNARLISCWCFSRFNSFLPPLSWQLAVDQKLKLLWFSLLRGQIKVVFLTAFDYPNIQIPILNAQLCLWIFHGKCLEMILMPLLAHWATMTFHSWCFLHFLCSRLLIGWCTLDQFLI